MRWRLVAALVASSAVAASSTCLSSLPPSKLNDNFCDCGDDEPLTSACSPLGQFACRGDDGALLISSSRVGDRVCDCCDGSDEEEDMRCPNTCAEKRAKREAEQREKAEVRARGEEQFRLLVAKACEGNGDGGAVSSETEHEEEEAAAAAAQAKRDARATELAEARVELAGEEAKLAPQRAQALSLDVLSKEELLDVVIRLAASSASSAASDKLEEIMRDLAGDDTLAWVEDNDAIEGVKSRIRALEEEDEEEEDKPEEEASADGEGDMVSDEDLGPAMVWSSLRHACFDLRQGQYKYELCLFKDFKQDHTLMGRWEEWEENDTPSSPFRTMKYTNGQHCHIGVDRSVRVRVECGPESKLVDLVEPSTCVYEATFQSPAACVPAGFQEEGQCSV